MPESRRPALHTPPSARVSWASGRALRTHLRAAATALASLLLAGASLAAGPAAAVPLTADDWQADFNAMLDGLARSYANFEDTVRVRRADLPAVAAAGRTALGAATDDAARRKVFERFVRNLADPHLRLDWSSGEGSAPGTACSADQAERATRRGIGFARLPGFRPLESAAGKSFQAGLLPLDRGRRVGVVRIAFFEARAFPGYCDRAALAAGLQPDSACDDDCGNAIEGRAGRLLNDDLVATVRELERAGATSILVDVTRNDGGSDWSEVVARVLAGPLRSARIAMLKHPAWTAFVEQRLQQIDAAALTASGPIGARLRRAAARLQAARGALSQPCELGAAWRTSETSTAPSCSNLVDGVLFATGVFDRDEDAPAGISADLYSPALYAPYPLRVTPLPLLVLVDRDTHSSAEQFAAVLRDNRRATIVGGVSAGAGCGSFTPAGAGLELPHSHGHVHAPDCVRWRADGSSERRGVTPDRLVPWGPSDSDYLRAAKVADVLRRLR